MEHAAQGSAPTDALRNTMYNSVTALHATAHAFFPEPEVIYMSTEGKGRKVRGKRLDTLIPFSIFQFQRKMAS